MVHAAHGIGLYQGIRQLDIQGVVKDYLQIQYDKGDTLYVPVTQLDLVSKYIGAKEETRVKLHRLGGPGVAENQNTGACGSQGHRPGTHRPVRQAHAAAGLCL